MPQVITTHNILGKLQMRHILFHVLLARCQNLVQVNIRFYRTRMDLVILQPPVIAKKTRVNRNLFSSQDGPNTVIFLSAHILTRVWDLMAALVVPVASMDR